MRRTVVLLAAVLGAAVGVADAAHTQAGAADALQAPECRAALAALQELEAAALASSATQRAPAASADAGAASPLPALRSTRPAIDPELAAAQRRAARSCLASRADPAVPGRLAQPPVAVPPVANARPPPAPTAPTTLPPARSPRSTPPVSITSCDAAGCWTSDGARLNRVGPTLWGSRGACSVVGVVVQCP
jgi:hypothetical protein